jgi:hypothetical protein
LCKTLRRPPLCALSLGSVIPQDLIQGITIGFEVHVRRYGIEKPCDLRVILRESNSALERATFRDSLADLGGEGLKIGG